MQHWCENEVAASDRVFRHPFAGKVQRTALAGKSFRGLPVLRMNTAHAGRQAGWADGDCIVERDAARKHHARHHGTRACEREAAVDRKSQQAFRAAGGGRHLGGSECGPQGFDAFAGLRRDGDHGRVREDGFGECVADLRNDLGATFGAGKVGLGERDNASVDAEQVEDGKVFARLRHDAVIDRHDQQREIDTA